MNAKDYTCYLENPATKNDSEKEFYKLRDVIFDALSEKTIRFFQENVKQISVTLDKVTGKSLSEAVSTFEKRGEEKSHFPSSFWEN